MCASDSSEMTSSVAPATTMSSVQWNVQSLPRPEHVVQSITPIAEANMVAASNWMNEKAFLLQQLNLTRNELADAREGTQKHAGCHQTSLVDVVTNHGCEEHRSVSCLAFGASLERIGWNAESESSKSVSTDRFPIPSLDAMFVERLVDPNTLGFSNFSRLHAFIYMSAVSSELTCE